jgi:mRNA interferase YafQ
MLRLDIRNRFHRDMKLAKKRGKDIRKLRAIVNDLQAGIRLAQKHKPHLLTGEWHGYMECHIEPDWLLIYHISPDALTLVRTGTHSDLFR